PGQFVVAHCPGTLAGRGGDETRHAARVLLHRGDDVVEVGFDLHTPQRLVAGGVVTTSVPTSPVLDDAFRKRPEPRYRVNHIEPAHPEGPAGPGDVVHVHVGDRRGH